MASLAACLLLYDEFDPPPAQPPVEGIPVDGLDASVGPPGLPEDAGSDGVDAPRDQPDAAGVPGPDRPGSVASDAGVSGCAGVGCAQDACDGGPCAPGTTCETDRDCASRACQDGRCCGGRLQDCTRCAERLSLSVDCEAPPLGVEPSDVSDCRAFLACLAEHEELCPTRSAPGCSGDELAAVCAEDDFGGRDGAGVTRATQVLQSAGCQR